MDQPVENYDLELKNLFLLWVLNQMVQPDGSVFSGYNTH